jgi:MFS family permease
VPVRNLAASTRATHWAITVVFGLHGVAWTAWASRIPSFRAALDEPLGALGVALAALDVGSLLAFPVSGVLLNRSGSRTALALFGLGLGLSLPMTAVARSLPWFIAALTLLGVCFGGVNMAMNAQGVTVEDTYRRPILGRLHAGWSAGAFVGAAFGSALSALGASSVVHLSLLGIVVAAVILWATSVAMPDTATTTPETVALRLPTRELAAVSLLLVCAVFAEGSVADWSAIYLRDSVGTSLGFAPLGLLSYSAAMGLTRLCVDAASRRFGPVIVARAGGLVAATAWGACLTINHRVAALVGFAFLGAGLASVSPLSVGAAARTPGIKRGSALAALSTVGTLGFLGGSPIIGAFAEATSLRLALSLLVLMALGVTALAPAVKRARVEGSAGERRSP